MPRNFKKIIRITNEGKDKLDDEVKVICVGQSRTGTSSLKAALSILLPGVTYHGMDFLNEINNQVGDVDNDDNECYVICLMIGQS